MCVVVLDRLGFDDFDGGVNIRLAVELTNIDRPAMVSRRSIRFCADGDLILGGFTKYFGNSEIENFYIQCPVIDAIVLGVRLNVK